MRARMALSLAGIPYHIREVCLKNKPAAMLALSPKATVPVLQCKTGMVLDESYDIMLWALQQDSSYDWQCAHAEGKALIQSNDTDFKQQLDRYKYPQRYHLEAQDRQAMQAGLGFLQDLNHRLTQQSYLLAEQASMADLAIFPFVRQFAAVDKQAFAAACMPALEHWLQGWLQHPCFQKIMIKQPVWQEHRL